MLDIRPSYYSVLKPDSFDLQSWFIVDDYARPYARNQEAANVTCPEDADQGREIYIRALKKALNVEHERRTKFAFQCDVLFYPVQSKNVPVQ